MKILDHPTFESEIVKTRLSTRPISSTSVDKLTEKFFRNRHITTRCYNANMSHVMVWRGALPEDGLQGFWHHGILCDDGTVIHYSGMDGMKTLHNGEIKRTGMDEFAVDAGRHVHTVEYNQERRDVYSPKEVVRRAESRLGEQGYDLVRHNCENFARWCVVGESKSFQVQGAWVGLALAAGAFAVSGGTGLLGAALTGIVGQRMWDANRNVSKQRRRFNVDGASVVSSSSNSSGSRSPGPFQSHTADAGSSTSAGSSNSINAPAVVRQRQRFANISRESDSEED